MADEIVDVRVWIHETEQAPQKMVVEWSAQALDHNSSIPHQQRPIDAAFAEEQREPSPGAGLFAMWAGMLLLKDVLKGPEPADNEREKKLNAKQRDCECC